jgi:hypothetical protein
MTLLARTPGGISSVDVTDQRILDYGYAALGAYGQLTEDEIEQLELPEGFDPIRGHWVVGRLTTPNEFSPLSGNATFSGQLAGTTFDGEEVGGIINLSADFDMARLTGELQVQRDGTPLVNASTDPLSLVTGEDEISYSGQLNVEGGGDGFISGLLYGENAQGTGGVWSISNAPDSIFAASGVFLAETGQHVELPEIPEPTFSREPTIVGRAIEYRSRTARFIFQNNFFGASTPLEINNDDPLVNVGEGLDDEYLYTSWGSWTRPDTSRSFNPVRANYVIGPATLPEDLPRSGTAEFSGEMSGFGVSTTISPLSGPNTRGFALEGDISLNANFADSSIDGSYELRRTNGDVFNTGNINPTNIQIQQDTTGFSSTFNNGGPDFGSIDGIFYGPRAEEIGGSWDIGGGARGVYRARQIENGVAQ